MVSRFKITMHTDLGELACEVDANNEQQLRSCMPSEVTFYSIDGVADRLGIAELSDDALWLRLASAVSNIELANVVMPEDMAKYHAEQVRAVSGLRLKAK